MADSDGDIGYGLELTIDGTPVAEVVDATGPDIKIKAVDVTSNDSPDRFREKKPGLGDGGEITFTCIATPENRAQLNGALGDEGTAALALSNGGSWSSEGFLSGLKDGIPLDDAMTLDATWTCSGKPTFTG